MCSCLCTVLPVSLLYFKKKHWNRLRENSSFRHFVTYQITFLLTCQPHKKCSVHILGSPWLKVSFTVLHCLFKAFVVFYLDCGVNVHKRCKNNVAANCGVNSLMIAEMLKEMGMNANTDKLDQLVLKVYFYKLFC